MLCLFRNLSIPLEVFRLLFHRPASRSVSASLRRPVPCFTRFRFSSLRYEVFKVRIRGVYLLPNLSFQRSEMFFQRLSRGKTRSWRTFKTIHEGKSRLRAIPDGLPVLCPALRPALRFRFAPCAFLFVSVLPLRLSPLRFPETIDLG